MAPDAVHGDRRGYPGEARDAVPEALPPSSEGAPFQCRGEKAEGIDYRGGTPEDSVGIVDDLMDGRVGYLARVRLLLLS